jgi:hypothetical protein
VNELHVHKHAGKEGLCLGTLCRCRVTSSSGGKSVRCIDYSLVPSRRLIIQYHGSELHKRCFTVSDGCDGQTVSVLRLG